MLYLTNDSPATETIDNGDVLAVACQIPRGTILERARGGAAREVPHAPGAPSCRSRVHPPSRAELRHHQRSAGSVT